MLSGRCLCAFGCQWIDSNLQDKTWKSHQLTSNGMMRINLIDAEILTLFQDIEFKWIRMLVQKLGISLSIVYYRVTDAFVALDKVKIAFPDWCTQCYEDYSVNENKIQILVIVWYSPNLQTDKDTDNLWIYCIQSFHPVV
jgi:hypothetical protein